MWGVRGGKIRSCGGAWEGVGWATGRRGGRGGRPPQPPQNPPPSQAATQPPQPPPRSESFDESDDGAIPRAKKPKLPPPTTTTAWPTKAVSAFKPNNPPYTATANPPPPPPTKTDTPKGAEKKDDRPEDPIVGTVVHVPYSTGIERGAVRGIHGRKYGAVWVEYPGGTTLYEVARPLLFPTLERAERYREEAQAGKKKPKPPAPTNKESDPPNVNPTTEPTNPTNPTNPASVPAKMWDPTVGSHEVEGPG